MAIIYDMEWVKEIGKVMQKKTNHLFRQFQHKDIFHVVEQVTKEMC
jgi:hypothetical protein